MASLLDLSHEILQCILTFVEPVDLGSLSRTCRSLSSFIKSNQLLCKELYLQKWGTPRNATDKEWEERLHQVVRSGKILDSEDTDLKRDNLKSVGDTILSLLSSDGTHENVPWLAKCFASQSNIDALLAGSSLFSTAGSSSQTPVESKDLQQMSAKLHCYYGVPIDFHTTSCNVDGIFSSIRSPYHIIYPQDSRPEHGHQLRSRTRKVPTNHVARARVYDLRRYTDESLWGPFKDDGSQAVDWEKVEAVMIVLGYNLRLFSERADGLFDPLWDKPWHGVGAHSYESLPQRNLAGPPSPPSDLDLRDPYGVTGIWMRVVCFLDYNDLYAFNFGDEIPPEQEREPIDTREAIRMIKLNIKVTKIGPPGEDDGQDLPVVYFKGTSRSLHASWDPNANSKIRGQVRQTREGEIRWTTWSIFHGEERWRSEGIQVGGLRSGRGVLGNWFDKDYDIQGPAGPTAFWKISDDYVEDKHAGNLPFAYILGAHDDSEED